MVKNIWDELTPVEEEKKDIWGELKPINNNAAALSNVKSAADMPDVDVSYIDKAREAVKNVLPDLAKNWNTPMSWLEAAYKTYRYIQDDPVEVEANPLKAAWKNSLLGMVEGKNIENRQAANIKNAGAGDKVLTQIPDKVYDDWDKKGKVGAVESAMRTKWTDAVPFAGTIGNLVDSLDINQIQDKYRKGEKLSQKEVDKLNGYILDQAEQAYRGVTIGGKFVPMVIDLPAYMGEFILTDGLAAAGKAAVQKTATKGLQEITEKGIAGFGKKAAKNTIELAGATLARTAIGMPQSVAARYQENKLNDSLAITDKGQVFLEASKEAPALAFAKAFGDVFIENFSEGTGEGLSYVGEKLLPKGFKNNFIKAVQKFKPSAKISDFMTKAGYHGLLEEMGEERIGDIMKAALGVDDRKDVSYTDKLIQAAFPDPEQLLLEAGLFAIPGSASFAASKLNEHLSKKGMSQDDIDGINHNISELEREQLLDKFTDEELQAKTIEEQKVKEEIQEDFYNKAIQAGRSEEEAHAVSQIMGARANAMSKRYGVDAKEWYGKVTLQGGVSENVQSDESIDTKVNRSPVALENSIAQAGIFKPENKENLKKVLKTKENAEEEMAIRLKHFEDSTQEINEVGRDNVPSQFILKNKDAKDAIKSINSIIDELPTEAEYIKQQKSTLPTENVPQKLFQSNVAYAGAKENETADAVKEWKEKGTESKYFKNWFGDSKVINGEGKPLVVYHGTSNGGFDTFDTYGSDYGLFGQGSYFTENSEVAESYTDKGKGQNKQVYPVYLNIKNPLDMDAQANSDLVKAINEKGFNINLKEGMTNEDIYRQLEESYMEEMYSKWEASESIQADIESLGYDGITHLGGGRVDKDGVRHKVYIAFHPEQIKSVENQGTFSKDTGNIYYQFAGKNAETADAAKLQEASERLDAGEDAETIRKETGWFKGADGKMRFEISDKDAEFSELGQKAIEAPKNEQGYYELQVIADKERKQARQELNKLNDALSELYKLEEENKISEKEYKKQYKKLINEYEAAEKVVDETQSLYAKYYDERVNALKLRQDLTLKDVIKHDKLFQAYPGLKNVNIEFDSVNNSTGGSFTENTWTIQINTNNASKEEIIETLMHEIQHVIQAYEGFARGGNLRSRSKAIGKIANKINEEKELEIEQIYKSIYEKHLDNKEKAKIAYELTFSNSSNWEENLNELYAMFGSENNYKNNIRPEIQKELKKLDDKYGDKLQDEVKEQLGSDEYDYYKRLHGEIEARETSKRALMSDSERKDFYPYGLKSYEWSNIDNAIVVFSDGTEVTYQPETFYQSEIPANKVDWTNKFKKNPSFDEIKDYINKLAESGEAISTLSEEWFIDIINRAKSKRHILVSSKANEMSNAEKNRHNKYISGIDELIRHSEYNSESKNNKNDKKPNVEKYHYFTSNVKIGEKTYSITLVAEQFKGEKEIKPQTVHLYDVIENKTSSIGSRHISAGKQPIEDVNNNITYNQSNFNPKGQIEIGSDKNIITLFESADKSTLLHELGHLFLNDTIALAQSNEQARKDLDEINTWLGYNGQEYTVAQQEKFARGFEAYLMSGKATTNFLKNVFENFKAWLLDIYGHVSNLGVDINDDTVKLFNKLFASPEEHEEYRASKKLLAMAIQAGNKEANTELKKEVKSIIQEAFRSIINKELGKNYDLPTAAREWGKAKKNDKFADKVGNWGTENDYQYLAEQIAGNKYSEPARNFVLGELGISQDLTDFDSPEFVSNVINLYGIEAWNYIANTEKVTQYADLDGIEKQYAPIIKSYEKSKNRNIEQMAFYDWLETIDEEYRDEFAEQWINDTNNIDRLENLDKFEKAKEIILQNASKMVTFNSQQEYENVIKETFNGLKFLTSADKQRLLYNILSMKTVEDLKNNIDDIIDLSKTMEDVTQRRILAKKIDKLLKTNPIVKQGNSKKGRYDYETNKIFFELRRINKLSVENVRAELEQIEFNDEQLLTFEERLRRKLLNFRSDYVISHSTDFISSLYEDLLQLRISGKLAKDEIDHEKRLNKRLRIEELLHVLSNKKEAGNLTRNYVPLLANWESALNTIFNKGIKDFYSLLNLESDVQNYSWKEKSKLTEKAAAAYGVKPHQLDSKIIDNLSEKFLAYEYLDGGFAPQEREINKMNIIEAYIWQKNPILKERLENQFSKEGLIELLSNLSEEDIAFADVMQRTANNYYNAANKVFIKKYGIELPKVANYFPSVTERVSEIDLLNDYVMRSTAPSFIKSRADNTGLLMKFSNPMQLLYSHIDKMSRFIHMTETLDMYNQVFKNPVMSRAISQKYGDETYKSLIQMLANSSFTRQGADYDGVSKIANNFINNWVVTKIALKPTIAIKQLLSTINYSSEMPFTEWSAGYIKALSNPKKTIEFMKKDEYLKTRMESGGQSEFLEETINNSQFSKTKKLTDWFSLNMRLGDIGAIYFGGKPYIDYLINKKGMTEEEAFKEFRLHTMRTMQASMPSSLSNFQNNFKNPFMRVMFAFRNTSNQYARKMADSIVSYSNGDYTAQQMGKDLFIYGFVNSLLYRTATSLSILRFLLTGDDDNLKADIIQSIFDLNSTVMPFIGDAYQYALTELTGQKGFGAKIPVYADIIDAVDRFGKDGVGLDDFMNIVAVASELALGIPTKSIINMAGGIGDIAQGNAAEGALRTAGYSKYTSAKAVGGESD